jgi:hypothetical protein
MSDAALRELIARLAQDPGFAAQVGADPALLAGYDLTDEERATVAGLTNDAGPPAEALAARQSKSSLFFMGAHHEVSSHVDLGAHTHAAAPGIEAAPVHENPAAAPALGHENAAMPATPGHENVAMPATPGHGNVAVPATPGHENVAEPTTPGHENAAVPVTPGHETPNATPGDPQQDPDGAHGPGAHDQAGAGDKFLGHDKGLAADKGSGDGGVDHDKGVGGDKGTSDGGMDHDKAVGGDKATGGDVGVDKGVGGDGVGGDKGLTTGDSGAAPVVTPGLHQVLPGDLSVHHAAIGGGEHAGTPLTNPEHNPGTDQQGLGDLKMHPEGDKAQIGGDANLDLKAGGLRGYMGQKVDPTMDTDPGRAGR